MRRVVRIAVVGLALGGLALLASGETHRPSSPAAKPRAEKSAPAMVRYASVQPIFATHCAKCHDARIGTNAPAQAVFEMTSYPFATKRPGTLIEDLKGMIPKRGALSADEKALALTWLEGGALDDAGKPPAWRAGK